MKRLSMATRDELVAAAGRRYAGADRDERGLILDELTSLTGLPRKHAARLLRVGCMGKRRDARPERRIYDDAMREALVVIWKASDRVCGKRCRCRVNSPQKCRLKIPHSDAQRPVLGGGHPPA